MKCNSSRDSKQSKRYQAERPTQLLDPYSNKRRRDQSTNSKYPGMQIPCASAEEAHDEDRDSTKTAMDEDVRRPAEQEVKDEFLVGPLQREDVTPLATEQRQVGWATLVDLARKNCLDPKRR